MPTPRLRALLLLLCGLSPLSACASSGSSKGGDSSGTPYVYRKNARQPKSIGAALGEISIAIEEWNGVVLSAGSPEDERKGLLLEDSIRRMVLLRFEEIVDQLATGPVINRRIAAAALGFSDEERALSALLAALEDPSIDVQSNALLGLGQLARADTPLGGIVTHMQLSYDDRVRSHAARALHRVLEAGSPQEEFLRLSLAAVRAGLSDSSPEVRSYSALMIARVADAQSIDSLKLLVYDETPIAALAAARALAFIGDQDPYKKGECARALCAALDKVDESIRARLLIYLQFLSGKNWGRDTEPWLEWAGRLP